MNENSLKFYVYIVRYDAVRCKVLKQDPGETKTRNLRIFNASAVSQYVITDKRTLRGNTEQCYRND